LHFVILTNATLVSVAFVILTNANLARSNSALPDDGDYTETS